VHETRLLRLLEAPPSQLGYAVRSIVQQLVQKGQTFDPDNLAELVLTAGTEGGRFVRSQIARDYYRYIDDQNR
jgi:hypothetical protein